MFSSEENTWSSSIAEVTAAECRTRVPHGERGHYQVIPPLEILSHREELCRLKHASKSCCHASAGQELGRQPALCCQSTRRGKDHSLHLPSTDFTVNISFKEISIPSARRVMRLAEALTAWVARSGWGAVLITQTELRLW